ncbi:Vacuolar protein-sorting-associated protein 28, partial [Ptychographa xylographoides]|nr:Vacuolar protein-sorting-associated protein 28 [Ptychographa xylographoides]
EVKLLPRERELYESLAEIYSIIITIDGLERAYIKDSVTEAEYTDTCQRLLKQYSSTLSDEGVRTAFIDLETFRRKWDWGGWLGAEGRGNAVLKGESGKNGIGEYRRSERTGADESSSSTERGMDCPRAIERIRTGIPLTLAQPSNPSITHPHPGTHANPQTASPATAATTTTTTTATAAAPNGSRSKAPSSALVLAATENFITFLDALKLSLLSKDQLHPLLSEVIQSLSRVVDGDFVGRADIVKWLIRLNGMKANEELGEGEARELMFEMEGAYAGFKGMMRD